MSRSITAYVHNAPVVTGHFDVGRDYYTFRPHGTRDYLLILTCAGHGCFACPKNKWLSGKGDICLIRPGVLHDYSTDEAASRWELKWAHFTPHPDWLDLLDWPDIIPGVMRLHIEETAEWTDAMKCWQRVHSAALSGGPLRDRLALNAMEAMLLTFDLYNPHRNSRRVDPLVRQTVAYITAHLGEPLAVEDLAEQVGLSPSRFAHRFRDTVGRSPAAFVESCRIHRATQLLTTTALSVKEVAAQLGFSSQFYFSLRFKKHTGHSPTDTRRMALSGGSG